MPVKSCELDTKPGFKWGDAGKCYTYTKDNEGSLRNARKKAAIQGLAIGDFSTMGEIICKNCGWKWNISDGGNDPYICHKCGYDNQPKVEDIKLEGIRVSFDYHETLTTDKGKTLLEKELKDNNIVYIISAAHDDKELLPFAEKYGIRKDRIFATGSNQKKVDKIKELNIARHYDNAQQVKDILDSRDDVKVDLIKV